MSHSATAEKLVFGDRNADYGNPREDFEAVAKVWSGLMSRKLTEPITATDVPILMVGLKLCRHMHKPKDDNIVDAHGYLLTLEWVETNVRPDDPVKAKLLAQLEELRRTVEDVCTGAGLTCDKCFKKLPCCCEHEAKPA